MCLGGGLWNAESPECTELFLAAPCSVCSSFHIMNFCRTSKYIVEILQIKGNDSRVIVLQISIKYCDVHFDLQIPKSAYPMFVIKIVIQLFTYFPPEQTKWIGNIDLYSRNIFVPCNWRDTHMRNYFILYIIYACRKLVNSCYHITALLIN